MAATKYVSPRASSNNRPTDTRTMAWQIHGRLEHLLKTLTMKNLNGQQDLTDWINAIHARHDNCWIKYDRQTRQEENPNKKCKFTATLKLPAPDEDKAS
jgi:hypothetical protein